MRTAPVTPTIASTMALDRPSQRCVTRTKRRNVTPALLGERLVSTALTGDSRAFAGLHAADRAQPVDGGLFGLARRCQQMPLQDPELALNHVALLHDHANHE